MRNHFYYNIDVVGTCNLRCPSCPVGNSSQVKNPRGVMKADLLREIMEKAVKEGRVDGVGLFNWTDPLLHSDISRLVEVVQSYDVPCALSSNLNLLKKPYELLQANPAKLRVSVSGFTQDVYSLSHRGGDIDIVKRNMSQLSDIKKQVGSSTKMEVLYHRYLGNLDDEIRFRRFAENLGYQFTPCWAFFMPLEKMLAYLTPDRIDVTLSDDDYALIDRLALSLDRAAEIAVRYQDRSCKLKDEQMTLDVCGNVIQCCALFDSRKYTVGNFMEVSVSELQRRKENQAICTKCTACGLHVYATYDAPEFDQVAVDRLGEYYFSEANLNLPTMPSAGKLQTMLRVLVPHRFIQIYRHMVGRRKG